MKATILSVAPPSGEYEEIALTKDGSGVWVKFEDEDGAEFCVVFGGGTNDATKVEMLGARAFILAHGKGYVFDAEAKQLILETGAKHYKDCISNRETGQFIACTVTEIDVFADRLLWSSPRVALDGIALLAAENSIISGEVYTVSGWRPFSLDLKKHHYRCDYDWQGSKV